MATIVNSWCVLAVRDLAASTRYYVDVLGFTKEPIDGPGWSFLSRDTFRVMLGECVDERPAGELGNHSYFDGGTTKDSYALCDQIRTVDQRRFKTVFGSLSVEAMAKIDAALLISLGLPGGLPRT